MQHRAKKRFGQNFLVDANVIDKIIHSINPQAEDHIVEIGPGLGALTQPLLKTLLRLDVIELDRDVIPRLKTLEGSEKLHIHNIDVLAFDFTEFRQSSFEHGRLRIIGNLPYNISTAVLFHLIGHRNCILDLHFMLQKEVVERIAASARSNDYGRLSVMMQLYFRISPLFTVAPQCFRPVPGVESAIVRMVPRTSLAIDHDEHDAFAALVRQAFSQRRKTIKNTLKGLCSSDQIGAAGIDPGKRPQELSVDDYIRLFRQVP
jgi:16S rRNA (adenine1518-N6/adenine1519-N6)-dimethyltransferase